MAWDRMKEFMEFYDLPKILPNSSQITSDNAETFDDLIEILSKVNPFWILDMYVYISRMDLFRYRKRFSEAIEDPDYQVNETEMREIRSFLMKLAEDLQH